MDGVSVHLTNNVKLASMSEKASNRILSSLFQIVQADIDSADLSFPSNDRMRLKADTSSQIVANYPK